MHFKENCCKFEGEKRSSNSSLLTHFISWFLIRTTQTRETRNQKPTQTNRKRPLISDHIKGPLVAAFRSPLMKALDRSVETLGLWIVTSSVTFIKSANQCSIKLCLTNQSFSHDICDYQLRKHQSDHGLGWIGQHDGFFFSLPLQFSPKRHCPTGIKFMLLDVKFQKEKL